MKLRPVEGLTSGVAPQAAASPRTTSEPDAPLPADSSDLSEPRAKATPQPRTKSAPPEQPPIPPAPAPVPTTLVQLEETPAGTGEAAPVGTAPAVPPPPAPRPPTATRVAELPKGHTLFNVLTRALYSSRRIGFQLLSVVAVDPLKQVRAEQQAVNALEPKLNAEIEAKTAELKAAGIQNADVEAARAVLQARTVDFRARLENGAKLEDLKVEAFAVARKAAEVVLKMRPYDVQVQGGLAMTEGRISEMKTGEGKTLTAVMPLYLYGLTGKGAHLVTVNDYLVKRDFTQMKPVFEFLGLSAGCVHEQLTLPEKKAAYACDVTYVTNHSEGFDFLRDSMARDPEARVQRAPNFALVDEVDEILIDEARTPLILSSMAEAAGDEHRTFDIVVKALKPGHDYKSNHKDHYAYLTEDGLKMVETMLAAVEAGNKEGEAAMKLHAQLPGTPLAEVQAATKAYDDAHKATLAINRVIAAELAMRNASTDEEKAAAKEQLDTARAGSVPTYDLYSKKNVGRVFFLQNALNANTLFEKDKDYLAADDKVEIVDMFKGRTMEGRRYTNGLHQALEAKEGVTIQPYQRTLAQITYPDLFRRFPHLAGMSGTAMSAAGEFNEAYNLDVVAIPTNKPKALETDNDIVFRTAKEKFEFVADKVAELYKEGKPVLVGTRSIPANKYLSFLLKERGIHHQVLNAQSVHENTNEEAEILADAGRSGMVTIATNMAGRGVDIKPDLMNYKLMAVTADVASRNGKAVVVDVSTPKDAEQVSAWLDSGACKYVILPEGQPTPKLVNGQTLIRINPAAGDQVGEDAHYVDGRSVEYRTSGDTGRVAKLEIHADKINFKKLAEAAKTSLDEGKFGVYVDVDTDMEAHDFSTYLDKLGVKSRRVEGDTSPIPNPGEVTIRYGATRPPAVNDATVDHLDGRSDKYQTGGLHLIMTERHEAERIDLQLEGRPARQGQPGYRLAVLSIEDELLKYFGGDKLAKFFDAMGVPEGKGVSDPRIDDLVKRAQGAVEGKYYEVRKDTTKYGAVGNKQREVFTEFRDELVKREADTDALAREWIPGSVAYEAFALEAERQRDEKAESELEWVGLPKTLNGEQLQKSLDELSQKYGFPITAEMPDGWFHKKKKISLEELEEAIRPQLMKVYDEAAKDIPQDELARAQRKVILDVADNAWMSHLENMEGLRNGVGMEAMAQKDPWIEYQLRAFDLFKDMMASIHHEAGAEILTEMRTEAANKVVAATEQLAPLVLAKPGEPTNS